MAADICVDVAKYSHAIGENKDRTIPWTHLTSSDLSLVLKGEDTDIRNGRLCMQIVQGNAAHVWYSHHIHFSGPPNVVL
jgi:hypothetical protein